MSENYRSREERKKIQQEKKAKPTKNKAKKPLWKKIMLICLSIFVFCIIVGAGTFLWMIRDVPSFDETLLKDPVSSNVYDINGDLIDEIGVQKREQIEYEDIPKVLEEAVLSIEDSRFYEHNGFDPRRFMGAVVANFKERSFAEGGSTITQQVVKNSFFTNEKTIKRKVQELYLSFQLERKFSKQQILTIYLNKILYGGRIYGAGKAADYYFSLPKDKLHEMTLEQAALLAGLPQSPNNYNPEKYPEKAEARRNTVLAQMHKNGYITEAEMKTAQSKPVTETLKINNPESGKYAAFVDTAIEEVTNALPDINVSEAGLEIHTTLDPKVQQATEDVLAGNGGVKFPDANFQAGIAIVDTESGQIKAIGGGRDYKKGGHNKAKDIRRQPGSTFKPLIDYAPAIEKHKWATSHELKDEPYTYKDGNVLNNFDKKFKGHMTMRDALVQSRNVPAVKALNEAGIPYARDFVANLGISVPEKLTESAGIGSFDPGTSPLEMAGAYAAFGNGGSFTKPYAVTKVVFPDKTEQDLVPETKKAMKDSTAFLITDMLRGVTKHGTGTAANVSKLDIAGKTGTTNFADEDIRKFKMKNSPTWDSWFVGYTPQYSTAVWTGYDKTSETDYIKGKDTVISQQIFKAIMSKVGTDTSSFKAPNSVEKVGNEYRVKGGEEIKAVEEEKLAKPNVNANYDAASKSIKVNWSFQAPENETATFEVSYTVDGATTPLAVSGNSASIPNAIPGKSYTISVVAVTSKGKSEPGTITVTPTAAETPDPNQPDPNKPDPNKPDPNKPDPNKPDPNKPDPNKPDPNKPDPNKPDPNKPDPNKPDPNKPDPNKPNPGNGGNGNNNR
ncbi:penicillin-binding protein 1A [Priestia taiwanensis]|uniref:Penicillin-binding protein n=1 Tax=Priestia taiwanensis TaxID=1347902 RepID=A0A917AK60_9BACI|nr:penicillin-binding protein 1A [Priestia taiwanensis]MBM7361739.1 penicillin-binding protein 1A [Priestia taiwanensis]GGE56589.1 penicillin-binding protein [Priestia taiwanensis]